MTFKKSDLEVVEEIDEEEPTSKREFQGYLLQRFDPNGFIRISQIDKPGPRPEELSGVYTDFTSAERSIVSYLNQLASSKKNKTKVA